MTHFHVEVIPLPGGEWERRVTFATLLDAGMYACSLRGVYRFRVMREIDGKQEQVEIPR